MQQRISQGYYSIYVENEHDSAPCVDINELADLLPHGSGIDGDYHIRVFKNGSVHVYSEFHKMDEYGCYDGWVPFTVMLSRAKSNKRHPLNTPGFYQIIEHKGDILMSVRVAGDLGDYLFDVMLSDLAPLLKKDRAASRNDTFGPNGKPAQFSGSGWVEVSDV